MIPVANGMSHSGVPQALSDNYKVTCVHALGQLTGTLKKGISFGSPLQCGDRCIETNLPDTPLTL